MFTAAKHIEDWLTGMAPLQAEINDRSYWELAPPSTIDPYVTFSIRENRPATKSSRYEYDVSIFVWHNRLTEAARIGEIIKANRHPALNYRGGRSGYADADGKEAYIQLNFNFKITT